MDPDATVRGRTKATPAYFRLEPRPDVMSEGFCGAEGGGAPGLLLQPGQRVPAIIKSSEAEIRHRASPRWNAHNFRALSFDCVKRTVTSRSRQEGVGCMDRIASGDQRCDDSHEVPLPSGKQSESLYKVETII
jgi:hypothetical protein